ncbi:MAG: CMP/dCMP deaminase zinc-binding, partial [Actinomycetia bacterium]|nr:CMP/dCMP deaminase zinc-binding [Actinomycetes bacterium]
MSDDAFLRQAIELSASARANGNLPFGAVLVLDGEVLLTAENATLTTGDVTRHAEIDLVRATAGWDRAVLAGATIYASGKPCPMCTGAIELAGIGRVVFGVDATTLPGF